jgi:hypothetical protein
MTVTKFPKAIWFICNPSGKVLEVSLKEPDKSDIGWQYMKEKLGRPANALFGSDVEEALKLGYYAKQAEIQPPTITLGEIVDPILEKITLIRVYYVDIANKRHQIDLSKIEAQGSGYTISHPLAGIQRKEYALFFGKDDVVELTDTGIEIITHNYGFPKVEIEFFTSERIKLTT